MNEKDLIKQAIEEHIFNKDTLRRTILHSVPDENQKIRGGIFMKKKLVITTVALALLCAGSVTAYAAVDAYQYNLADNLLSKIGIEADSISRNDAKKVYNDIVTDAFEYQTTIDILGARAEELGIESVSKSGREVYQQINDSLTPTAKVTSAQIAAIKVGTSYQDIVAVLGNTKDIGSGRTVLQYAVDDNKILFLSFSDIHDICNESGTDLLKTCVDAKQDNQDNENSNTFNATLNQRVDTTILVSCPTFKQFDVISLSITKDTVIVFEDGSNATIDDITGDLVITITEQVNFSYPPQGVASKIIIK